MTTADDGSDWRLISAGSGHNWIRLGPTNGFGCDRCGMASVEWAGEDCPGGVAMRVGFFLWRVAFFAWGAACLGALVAFAIHGRWGALTLFSGLLGLFCAMNYFQRHGPGTVRRGQVDYDRINRQEFELGIPFSSRPEPWRPPEVRTIGAAYLVFCPDCQYRSIGHTTEASARQRAAAHYREHLTGETVDG